MSQHSNELNRVGVVGCGLMGSGIAEVCARAGCSVTVVEERQEALDGGRQRLEKSLVRAEAKGKLESAAAMLGSMEFTTDLSALADRELVIEAIHEDEHLKITLFADLDRIVQDEDAILASNTSSIPIMKVGTPTRRPENVIGIHFFNPVPVLDLVEIVPSLLTSPETVQRATAFVGQRLGKHAIMCQDRAGFVVNALLIPFILSAIRMYESGFASAEDIDAGLVKGAAHPLGPLALADLIGLDTTKAVADSLFAEFKEHLYSSPALLSRMVDAGLLGRKSGRGFYSY